jgi:hypothetical protein
MIAREIANWIFAWDDAIEALIGTASIYSHSTEVAGFAAENLLDADRQTCFKTSATGTVNVTIDLGAAGVGTAVQQIYGIGILNHNSYDVSASGSLVYASGSDSPTTGFISAIAQYARTGTGNDDFFGATSAAAAAAPHRYWKLEMTQALANWRIGRLYLARSLYQLPNGVAQGFTRGYRKPGLTHMTPGGIRHHISQGQKLRVLNGAIISAKPAVRAQIKALIESCEVNDKCFIMSDPFGTTTFSGDNRYGSGIHACIDSDEWTHSVKVESNSDIPLSILEVL